MGDAENALPPSKKRAAGRELSRDNPGPDDDEGASEQETGTFKKASEEVLATRRIVKVRRNQTATAPSSNPFAGIRLIPPTESGASLSAVTTDARAVSEITVQDDDGKDVTSKETQKDKDEDDKRSESNTNEEKAESAADKENVEEKNSSITPEVEKFETTPKGDNEPAAGEDKTENEKSMGEDEGENEPKKDDKTENVETSKEGTPLSSFQQLSNSQNAFTGLAGTGFSSSTFSFGSMDSIPKNGSTGLGLSSNGSSSLFSTPGTSIVSKSECSAFPSMQEVSVETGEENERVAFTADSVLFEFIDGGWKERGKGELRVNVSTTGMEKARLLMRARGNYRLILNASLYADMKLTNMDKKGITFACMNSTSDGKDGLSTFALKFKDVAIVDQFRAAVTAHKGKTLTVLKTPENSPKASDE